MTAAGPQNEGMYHVAPAVAGWLAEGTGPEQIHVAQVVASRGFSSRDASGALAWTDGGAVAGALFPGLDTDLRAAGGVLDGRLVERVVQDAEAVAAGLACGGTATVLVQRADRLPGDLWERLRHREPLCLVTAVVAGAPAHTEVYTRSDVRDAVRLPGGAGVPRLFARGAPAAAVVAEGATHLVAVALWPPTTLLVVGDGTIADALADMAAVLGWTAVLRSDGAAEDVAAALTESDAAVVLSHDRAVDVPALARLLAGRCGYVGALGSRATQAARRDGLLARGVGEDALARVHGPAGLDIDAHTPGEIAVSILAEVLAGRSAASGGSISARPGPVHVTGVHAPPPRY